MKLKTVSVDLEAFNLMKKEKRPRESYGDVVRRVFADRAESSFDPSEHLDQLFSEFGGKGVLTPAGRKRVAARQNTPPRSTRAPRAV
jgi:predicted CopG family antitoxin